MSEKRVLDAARDFRLGASMLEAHFGERLFPLRSTVVTLAFSIELYLKYIAAKVAGQQAWGHDLSALYDGLPQGARDSILLHYKHTKQFAVVLHENRRVFENWRYIYEQQDGSFSLDFQSLRLVSNALEAAASSL